MRSSKERFHNAVEIDILGIFWRVFVVTNNVMYILTANVANSKNYKFIFMYYSLCFLPTLFTVLTLNSTKRWLYMTNSIHFFYISREIRMSLICFSLMAFYLIWVGFSLKIIILIGEHCYADFFVKNKHLIWNNLHVLVNRLGGKAFISDHRDSHIFAASLLIRFKLIIRNKFGKQNCNLMTALLVLTRNCLIIDG